MAANNRAASRAPGRTPPFVLVGLVLLVGILGFNYWSLSSTNSVLTSDLERVRVQKKSVDEKNAEVEKNLENANEELRRTQAFVSEGRKLLEEKDIELNTLKKDCTKYEGETQKLQEDLRACDSERQNRNSELRIAQEQSSKLQKALDEERSRPLSCDFGLCQEHVRKVLRIASILTGSDAMKKVLEENQLDAQQLMDGIDVPAPFNPAQDSQNIQQAQQPQPQNNQIQPQPQGNQNQQQPQGDQNQQQPQGDPNQQQPQDGQNQQQPQGDQIQQQPQGDQNQQQPQGDQNQQPPQGDQNQQQPQGDQNKQQPQGDHGQQGDQVQQQPQNGQDQQDAKETKQPDGNREESRFEVGNNNVEEMSIDGKQDNNKPPVAGTLQFEANEKNNMVNEVVQNEIEIARQNVIGTAKQNEVNDGEENRNDDSTELFTTSKVGGERSELDKQRDAAYQDEDDINKDAVGDNDTAKTDTYQDEE